MHRTTNSHEKSSLGNAYLYVFLARFWCEKVHQMLAIMLDPKFKKCAFSHNICKLWKCIKFGCWLLLTIVIAFVIGKVFKSLMLATSSGFQGCISHH
jgi:hypothetical protein